jgi:HK97 family phage major capsid protein
VKSLEEIRAEYDAKFKELETKTGDLTERLTVATKADDGEAEAKELAKQLGDVQEAVKSLTEAREAALREHEFQSMKSDVETLSEALKGIRGDDRFQQGRETSQNEGPYGPGSDHIFYADAAKAIKGDAEAMERWQEALGEKSMTVSSGSTGGLLVPDQISSELLELKVQRSVLRRLFSSVQVNSDTLRIAGQTQGLVAGWVAELAEKPKSDLAFGEISVNVFWKAGMAVVSNQLLRNANQSVQGLINRDLSKRLALLEELAFIDGTGVGQPLGILRTPGVNVYDPNANGTGLASTAVKDLIDAIISAITNIYTTYQGPPTGILMHPRTWGRIVGAHITGSDEYLIGPPARDTGRQATDSLPGYGDGPLPLGNLLGLPVYTSPSVPTNLGGTTNQSVVIVGAFDEGLVLDHAGLTLDSSEHVYFTSNQTIFRAEDAVGFTAARYPQAFEVIGGAGLANG